MSTALPAFDNSYTSATSFLKRFKIAKFFAYKLPSVVTLVDRRRAAMQNADKDPLEKLLAETLYAEMLAIVELKKLVVAFSRGDISYDQLKTGFHIGGYV